MVKKYVSGSSGHLKFNQKVYKIVSRIPKGKVVTYGQIARIIDYFDQSRIVPASPAKRGEPGGSQAQSGIVARAVGSALHQNRDPNVPCHRVVDRDGRLAPNFAGPSKSIRLLSGRSGAFDGADEQRRRLLTEGVKFRDNMHVDLKECSIENVQLPNSKLQ